MPFFDWDDSYSVQINQFDDDHQDLIALLNEAHENFMANASQEATRVIIDRLVDYAQYHFSAEEKWMKDHQYEGLLPHTNEHDVFWRKVVDFQADYHSGKKQLSFEVLSFLRDWLNVHILTTDAEYGRFALLKMVPEQK